MKVIITIPTYEEAENIKPLIEYILRIDDKLEDYNLEVIVIDDDSPDNTAQQVRLVKDKRVSVLVRDRDERGRGLAGIAGFQYALNADADIVIEMDADFSHHPIFIPRLLSALEDADVVLGSRNIQGGFEVGRPFYRQLITFFANLYIRIMFWINVQDCNSGYRAYKRQILENIVPALKSKGPDIVQEVLFKIRKYNVKEVPIMFKEREKGTSTLTFQKVFRGYMNVIKLRLGL